MAWDFQQCCVCDQQSLRSACAYAQSDQSLCKSLEYFIIVKLLTEHHLECLSLKGGYTGSSESTHVKMPHCWKSHVTAHIFVHTLQLRPSYYNNGNKYHILSVYCRNTQKAIANLPTLPLAKTNLMLCNKHKYECGNFS